MPAVTPADRNPGNGRIPFVWVQDDDTGHRYDVREDVIAAGMTPVKDYPLNWSTVAREPKFATSKGGPDSVADDNAAVPKGAARSNADAK